MKLTEATYFEIDVKSVQSADISPVATAKAELLANQIELMGKAITPIYVLEDEIRNGNLSYICLGNSKNQMICKAYQILRERDLRKYEMCPAVVIPATTTPAEMIEILNYLEII